MLSDVLTACCGTFYGGDDFVSENYRTCSNELDLVCVYSGRWIEVVHEK